MTPVPGSVAFPRRLHLLLPLLLAACAHAGVRTGAGQLPREAQPVAYAIELHVDPAQPEFSGHERIALQLSTPTRRIALHGRGLVVTAARYIPERGSPQPLTYVQETDDGAATFTAPGDLPRGPGALEVDWHAPFGTQVDGLYTVAESGDSYAFTQFESVFARKMFPCFDEPSFKTPFEVTVFIPGADVAISNTPPRSEKVLADGTKEIHFAPTAPLPTYLLALMVGPFDVVAGPDVPPTETRPRPVPLRGVAVKGKGRLLGYALAHLGSYVTALEEYFGIAYPWEKLDVIAIPDFGPGAMENVGAITFREWLLLLEGENAPADQRHAFTAVATHELAHQWFGDLVTMAWWDDIWLNEAFASWMEAQVLQKLDPTLNTEVEMISAAQGAMASDSLESARRIRQPIVTTDDIFNAFDGLTYRKGAGVIGMFEQWVGVETFRKGVRSYLESHRYGNGSTFDFLQSISKAAGRDVEAPFLTFLNQPGVPIVDATLECKPGHAAIHVHQERYRPLGSHIDPVHTWQIPFCFRYGTGATDHEACALVTGSEQTIPLTDTACPDWLLPNRGGAGYYRFSLPADAARKLTAVRAKLNIPEQLALLDSIQAGEAADRLDIPTERTLLEPFASSPDRFVATAPMGPYGFIRNQIATPAERPLVERSADALYAPIGKLLAERLHVLSNEELLLLRSILGFQLETGRDAALRSEAASAGRRYLGLDPAVAGSPSLFDAASFLDLAVRTAVDAGDAGVFDTAVEHLRQTHEPAARSRLIRALGYATGPLGVRARALVLDPILRPSEVFLLLGTEASRPETREETWQWVQQHGDELIARLPEEHRGGVPFLASNFCSEERAREAEAYFQPRIARLPGGPRNLAGALESVRLCAARLQAHGPAVRALFKTEAQERPAR